MRAKVLTDLARGLFAAEALVAARHQGERPGVRLEVDAEVLEEPHGVLAQAEQLQALRLVEHLREHRDAVVDELFDQAEVDGDVAGAVLVDAALELQSGGAVELACETVDGAAGSFAAR